MRKTKTKLTALLMSLCCVFAMLGVGMFLSAQQEVAKAATEYPITQLSVAGGTTASVLNLYPSITSQKPEGEGGWETTYSFVTDSGDGFLFNGQEFEGWKIKRPNDFYVELGREAVNGDKITLDGKFTSGEVTFVFDDCSLTFDGTNWIPTVKTYETGALTPVWPSINQDASPAQLYIDVANEMPVKNWDYHFAPKSAGVVTLNGEAYEGANMQSPGEENRDIFISFPEVSANDVLVLEGTFYSQALAMEYVVPRTEIVFNGTYWALASEEPEEITYTLGKLVLHGNSKGAGGAAKSNNQLHLYSSSSVNTTWDETFSLESGEGIKINGEKINLNIKSPDDIVFLEFPAVEAGTTVSISGTWINPGRAIKYVIEESEFLWTGEAWEPVVNYTTYELGRLVLHGNSKGAGGAAGLNNQLHLYSPSSVNTTWGEVFTLESGDGIKINGEAISANIKSPDDLIFLEFAQVEAGTTVSISGTWVHHERGIKYVIEESKFLWNGEAWEPIVDYTTYELGKLVLHGNSKGVGGAAKINSQLHLYSSSSVDTTWEETFSLESGEGIKINGEKINTRIKSPGDIVFFEFPAAEAGTTVSISGTWIHPERAIKYVIEESAFVWTGYAWEPVVDYATHELGAMAFLYAHSETQTNLLYFYPANEVQIPMDVDRGGDIAWNTAFSYAPGSITLNDEAISPVVKFPGDMFVECAAAPVDGDVLVIGGAFYSPDLAIKYVIEETRFVWTDGAYLSELQLAKKAAKEDLSAHFETFAEEDYYSAEWTQMAQIFENGKVAVDEAASKEEVASVVAGVRAAFDEVLTKAETDAIIAEARVEAKSEINAYPDEANYHDAEWAEIQAIIVATEAEIDACQSIGEMDEIVAAAKTEIDGVKTAAEVDAEALIVAKADAKAEVISYYNALDLASYSDEANAQLSAYVMEASASIDEATTMQEVADVVSTFKANVDAVDKSAPSETESENGSVTESENGNATESENGNATESQASGCGASVSGGLVALLPALAVACGMIIRRKRED